MVAVQYEGAMRADPDNQKMKVKKFFPRVCMDWISTTCLYMLPLAVWPYWSKVAVAGPVLT